jgi:hypothetical protein
MEYDYQYEELVPQYGELLPQYGELLPQYEDDIPVDPIPEDPQDLHTFIGLPRHVVIRYNNILSKTLVKP